MNTRKFTDRRRSTDKILVWWLLGVTVIFLAVWVQGCHIDNNTDRLQTQQHELNKTQKKQSLTQASLNKTQRNQEAEILGSCRRVNTLRANDNRTAETLYETHRIAYRLVKNVDHKLGHRFIILSRTVEYIPPTDCSKAHSAPSDFVPPTPRPMHGLTHKQRERVRTVGFWETWYKVGH